VLDILMIKTPAKAAGNRRQVAGGKRPHSHLISRNELIRRIMRMVSINVSNQSMCNNTSSSRTKTVTNAVAVVFGVPSMPPAA